MWIEKFCCTSGDETVEHSVPPNPIESLGARIRDLDVDSIRRYLAQKLGLYEPSDTPVPVENVLDEVTLDGIVKWIKSDRCKNIITLSGAGISTCKSCSYTTVLRKYLRNTRFGYKKI